jgi:multisubunit Na+/H+ antiporter MnhE subunit
MVLVIRNYRVKYNLFSEFGIAALMWSALSCLLLFLLFISGAILALVGVGMSITAIVVDLIKKLKDRDSPLRWGDFLPLVVNIVWCLFAYFYVLRFWEIFGD